MGAQVFAQVCAALENLTFTDASHRQRIARQGGVECIVKALEQHQDCDSNLVRPAVDALWNLTFDDEAVECVTEAGGIEQICSVMRAHPGAAELQGGACAVLLNLAVREPNRWKIIQAGGVSLVTAAMRQHSQVEEVLEQGCQALYMLAYHENLRPHVVAAHAADAAKLAAACPTAGGRAQKWGVWLQEVLAC